MTRVINSTTFEVVEMNGGSTWIDVNAAKTNEFGQYRPDASHPQPRVKYTGSDIRFIYRPGTGPGSPGSGSGPGPGAGPGPGGGSDGSLGDIYAFVRHDIGSGHTAAQVINGANWGGVPQEQRHRAALH